MATMRTLVLGLAGAAAVALALPPNAASGAPSAAGPQRGSSSVQGKWVPAGHTLGRIVARLRDGRVLACGAPTARSAQLYLPHQNRWVLTGSLRVAANCDGDAAMLPSGKILLAGGILPSGHRLATAEIYRPASGTWTRTGSLNVARDAAAIARLPYGRIMLAGGYGPSMATPLTSVEIYHPRTRRWTMATPMAQPRANINAAVLNDGDILVAAGDEGGFGSTERYDLSTRTWQPAGHLIASQQPQLFALPSGRVLAIGLGPAGRRVRMYQPGPNRWITRPPLPRRWGYAPVASLHRRPMIIGGVSGSERSPHWGCRAGTHVYRLSTGDWAPSTPMPTSRCSFTVTTLRDGSILVVGGVLDNPVYGGHPASKALRFYPNS